MDGLATQLQLAYQVQPELSQGEDCSPEDPDVRNVAFKDELVYIIKAEIIESVLLQLQNIRIIKVLFFLGRVRNGNMLQTLH